MTAPGNMPFTPNNLPPQRSGNPNQAVGTPSPVQGGEVFRPPHHACHTEAEKFFSILNDVFGINHFDLREDIIQEALKRARQNFGDWHIPSEVSTENSVDNSLEAILQTLYLLFNDGYRSSSRNGLVREVVRLTRLLVEHPLGNQPRAHALLALTLLNSASAPISLCGRHNLLRLKYCDRRRWNRQMLEEGLVHFMKSCDGNEFSWYHLQSHIAACHCEAKDYQSTDWKQILSLYDRLTEFEESPVTALNRTIVFANIHGPEAGFAAVTAIKNQDTLNSHYLYYAVLGEFEAQLNDPLAAAGYFRKSLQIAETEFEQEFLSERFKTCEALIPI